MRIMVLSCGETAASILARGLRLICPDDDVMVGYEHRGGWTWDRHSGYKEWVPTAKHRYSILWQQWWMVIGELQRVRPDIIISEGVQGVWAATIARRKFPCRVIYWAVDWFPDRWQNWLDRNTARLADANWTAVDRVVLQRLALHVPFMYEPACPPRAEQSTLLYVGGIRKEASLGDALLFARKHGLELEVVGHPIDIETANNLSWSAGVICHFDAPNTVLFECLKRAKYGWAYYAGGESNYSNHATSRKIREYLEWSIIPVMAPEHIDRTAAEVTSTHAAYELAKQRQRMALEDWKIALEAQKAKV